MVKYHNKESVSREMNKINTAIEKAWENDDINVIELLLQEYAKLSKLEVSLMSPAEKEEHQHGCDLYDSACKGE